MNNASRRTPARTANRLAGWAMIGLAIVAALVTVLTVVSLDPPQREPTTTAKIADQPTSTASITVSPTATAGAPPEATEPPVLDMPTGDPDGVIPDGMPVSVFDHQTPAVVNLNGDLLAAIRLAATDALEASVTFQVTSGWRSPAYQEQLFQDAVLTYGSEEEAARWVATAGTSAHVSGDAIDIGPLDAQLWLAEHGWQYGLCQIYANEPWHYELRPDAITEGCPPMYADPTFDPRMQ